MPTLRPVTRTRLPKGHPFTVEMPARCCHCHHLGSLKNSARFEERQGVDLKSRGRKFRVIGFRENIIAHSAERRPPGPAGHSITLR